MNQQQLHMEFGNRVENNPESQNNLELQSMKFSKQCNQVLNILLSGEKLTSWSAMVTYKIGHLARRILDLKEKGIAIDDEWIEENGSRYKKYFLSRESLQQNLTLLNGNEKTKEGPVQSNN